MVEQQLMDFNDVKKYLKISRATLYKMLYLKKIPASKVGGQWRFRRERIDKWLEEQENTAKAK